MKRYLLRFFDVTDDGDRHHVHDLEFIAAPDDAELLFDAVSLANENVYEVVLQEIL
jgi:hypothetical protein